MGKRTRKPRPNLNYGSPKGFRDQRKSSKDTFARMCVRRKHNLNPSQQAQLLEEYGQLPQDKQGKKMGVKSLTQKYGVSQDYIYRSLVPRVRDTSRGENSLARKLPRRVSKIFTDEVVAFMEQFSEDNNGDFTWSILAQAINGHFNLPDRVPSTSATRAHCLRLGWKYSRQRVLPAISDKQQEHREGMSQ